MSNSTISRQALSRWIGWLWIANTVLYFCVGLNYLFYMPDFGALSSMTDQGIVMAWVFMLTGLLGQSALFALASAVIVWVLALCYPRRWFVGLISVFLFAVMALFLVTDALVYHLYHYHLAGVVWDIIRAGVGTQVLVLSWLEYAIAACIGLVFLIIEFWVAWFVWRWLKAKSNRSGGLISFAVGASLLLSYTISLSPGVGGSKNAGVMSNGHALVMEAQTIPYYNTVLGLLVPGKHKGLTLATRDDGYFVQNAQVKKTLNYPRHPLQCAMPHKPYNIVVIALDAWRFDMLTKAVTPNINDFSKQAWVFKDNLSGGNCTRPGIFSLFYGIPANYWGAALSQHRGSVLIQQLLQDHYQMGIFRSASMHYPAFDKTVFRAIKHLKINTKGAESFDRDRRVTQEFKHFIAHRRLHQPFFSFVFYDETHNYCESSGDYPKPFQPAVKVCNRLTLTKNTDPIPYRNRYRNAAHFDDQLTGQLLDTLKSHHLLENTIVVITADHGEEFNESHRGYWGHASDYTPWQIHTPMVIYWPGKGHRVFHQLTTHYDIVPTLMTQALGCKNPVSDYSVGVPIRDKKGPPFFIAGSYIDYAIINKHRVTRIYPGGDYRISALDGASIPTAKLNTKLLEQAFSQLNFYFK